MPPTYCPTVERLLRRALPGPHYAPMRQAIRVLVARNQAPSTLWKTWGAPLTDHEAEMLTVLDAAFAEDNRVC